MPKNDAPVIQNIQSPKKNMPVSEDRVSDIDRWLRELDHTALPDWDKLPDIGLYMDQVLTLMDRQLSFYKRSDDDKILTKAMINNYTKDGVLPRPVDKKYTPDHLALISLVCALKPVVSISDLGTLTDAALQGSSEEELYELYLRIQDEAFIDVRRQVLAELEPLKNASDAGGVLAMDRRRLMADIALRLSLEARVRVMMAQKLIDSIGK